MTFNSIRRCLLQFPLVPVYSNYPYIASAKLRPRHRRLEVEMAPPSSTGGPAGGTQQSIRTTLSSTKISKQSDLAVGVILNGELHITALTDVLQLRPTFLGTSKREDVEDLESDEEEGGAEEEGEDSNAAPLQQIHMRRKESDRAEASRTQSYAYMLSQEEAELWRRLKVNTPGTEQANEDFLQLYYDASVMEEE